MILRKRSPAIVEAAVLPTDQPRTIEVTVTDVTIKYPGENEEASVRVWPGDTFVVQDRVMIYANENGTVRSTFYLDRAYERREHMHTVLVDAGWWAERQAASV